jgi:hypothetical protein
MAIMIANVLSASFLTFSGGSWSSLSFVYIVSFFIGLLMVPPALAGRNWVLGTKDRWAIYFIVGFFIVCFIGVRVPYVLETVFGQVSGSVTGDDLWHVQELLSLTLSKQFPPLYGVFSKDYLLFYYTPWMLMAALMAYIPSVFASAKFAYALGYAIYILLAVPIVVALIRCISMNRSQFWMMIFLILGHAGMQSFNVFGFPFASHENWMGHYHVYVQFSAFSTLFIWVIHHVVAAITLLLAYLIYNDRAASLGRVSCFRRCLTLGLLFASAAMGSPFVCMGAVPLALWILWRDRTSVIPYLLGSLSVAAIVVSPLLWIYLQKPSDFRFFSNIQIFFEGKWGVLPNVLLSGCVFLILVAMEFIVPLVLWIRMRRAKIQMAFQDKVFLGIAIAMIGSTFLVGYGIYNNYAMRATILPIWVGLWVLARYSDRLPKLEGKKRVFALFFVGCMVLGSLNEIGSVGKAAVEELELFISSDPARIRIFQINQEYRQFPANAIPISASEQEMLAQKIGDTNARNLMLLERPLDFDLEYHENDEDLIGPAPAGLWKALDWRDIPVRN